MSQKIFTAQADRLQIIPGSHFPDISRQIGSSSIPDFVQYAWSMQPMLPGEGASTICMAYNSTSTYVSWVGYVLQQADHAQPLTTPDVDLSDLSVDDPSVDDLSDISEDDPSVDDPSVDDISVDDISVNDLSVDDLSGDYLFDISGNDLSVDDLCIRGVGHFGLKRVTTPTLYSLHGGRGLH